MKYLTSLIVLITLLALAGCEEKASKKDVDKRLNKLSQQVASLDQNVSKDVDEAKRLAKDAHDVGTKADAKAGKALEKASEASGKADAAAKGTRDLTERVGRLDPYDGTVKVIKSLKDTGLLPSEPSSTKTAGGSEFEGEPSGKKPDTKNGKTYSTEDILPILDTFLTDLGEFEDALKNARPRNHNDNKMILLRRKEAADQRSAITTLKARITKEKDEEATYVLPARWTKKASANPRDQETVEFKKFYLHNEP